MTTLFVFGLGFLAGVYRAEIVQTFKNVFKKQV